MIKVCLAYLLSKMACAWTMFWLLSLSIIMLSSCAGLIEVLHHRSEGIFFFSNWSDAFILGIMHRQQYITFFSTYLFFIFYFIIFIILLSLCGIGAPHRKCHELFMYKTDFALSGSPFAKKKDEKNSHSYNKKPSQVLLPKLCNNLTLDVELINFWSLYTQNNSHLEVFWSLRLAWKRVTRILKLEWSSSQY